MKIFNQGAYNVASSYYLTTINDSKLRLDDQLIISLQEDEFKISGSAGQIDIMFVGYLTITVVRDFTISSPFYFSTITKNTLKT